MAWILWLNWSGGGNLPPSLGIARALTERGHIVAFAGRPEMVPRVKTAGFRAIEITEAYAQVDRYPQGHFMTRAACYLTPPAVEAQLQSIVAAEAPDLTAIDAMFPAALAHASEFGCPAAVFVHAFVFRQLDMWRRFFGIFDGMRQQAGFFGLPGLDDLWRHARTHHFHQPRRIRRSPPARLGDGPSCRPGTGEREIRIANRAALAGGRRDAAGDGEFQHRVRTAQRREAPARARRIGRSWGSRRRHYRRDRCAE